MYSCQLKNIATQPAIIHKTLIIDKKSLLSQSLLYPIKNPTGMGRTAAIQAPQYPPITAYKAAAQITEPNDAPTYI